MSQPTEPRIRVLLVDDDALARDALKHYLSVDPTLSLAGLCGDGQEAVDFFDTGEADVVVMDIRMPRMDGRAAARAIKAAHPSVKILMLTSFDDDELLLETLGFGANGYVLKDSSPAAFADSIRAVAKGMTVLSRLPRKTPRVEQPPREDLPRLSAREREVLAHLCRGMSNQDIAGTLFLSESSVKAYAASLMTKLGVSSRLQVVVRAHELGLDREG